MLPLGWKRGRPGRRLGYNLRIRDEVEFAEEIGSYKKEHIERLEKILKKKGRR
jgi:hypothetical protein